MSEDMKSQDSDHDSDYDHDDNMDDDDDYAGYYDNDTNDLDIDKPKKSDDPEYFEYELMQIEDVERFLNEEVEFLCSSQKMPPSLAKMLLQAHDWKKDYIIEQHWRSCRDGSLRAGTSGSALLANIVFIEVLKGIVSTSETKINEAAPVPSMCTDSPSNESLPQDVHEPTEQSEDCIENQACDYTGEECGQPHLLDLLASVALLDWFATTSADQKETGVPTIPPNKLDIPQRPEMFNSFTQTECKLIKRNSVKVQALPETREFGTQTDHSEMTIILPSTNESLDQSFLSDITEVVQTDDDQDWVPDNEEIFPSDVSEDEPDEGPKTEATERKFIVFESCLDELMKMCVQCGDSSYMEKSVSGTYVKYVSKCTTCGCTREWGSQPMSGTMAYGNLVTAAGIMFSGASPIKVINAMNFSHVQFFSAKTYFKIQSSYLVPSVESVYRRLQSELLTDIILSGDDVRAGGDARCCSPGHTAKYSSYTIMDLTRSKILDVQLVQSNEVKNSYAMEIEGLKRCLAYLADNNVLISDLVTDRHSQVKKYMRDTATDIHHWFDVWHVAKGVYKKLEAAAKKKGCDALGDWARSISNHLYWCASSSGGDGDLVQEKWLSILNHVTNVHHGHGGNKFCECAHGPLEDRSSAWLKKGFKPYMELEKVVKGRLLLPDVKKLSPAEQTSSLESYHKVVCQFAPKFVHFSYPQMQARIQLSALHFNENSNRAQAVKKNGEPQYKISYPKSRKGQAIATEVKVQQTFGYIDTLMDQILDQRQAFSSYRKAKAAQSFGPETPVPISHNTPLRKRKADVVAETVKRFNR